MKKTVKIISFLLTLLLVGSVLISCANNTGNETTEPITTAAVDGPSTDDEVTTESGIKSNLPADLKYNKTVTVLVWNDVEHEEFDSEGQTGEIINDAIYARNLAVEEMLGLTINNIRRDGNSDNRNAWATHLKAITDTNDPTYDAVAGYSISVALNAVKGSLANLLNDDEFKYLDLNQPYWAKLLQKQCTIKGKLFFASGDISLNALEMMYVCFVNRTILENHNLENPQNLVSTKQWTLDKFLEMCEGVYEGIGDVPNEDTDTFGYMSSGIHFDPWFYACGALICETDSEGNLIASESFSQPKLQDTVEKFQKLWGSKDGLVGSSAGKHQHAFRDNRLLFCTERARSSHKTFAANLDCKFYVVPTPLYDENQDNYYTCMGNPFTLFGVVSCCEDREMSGAFLEAMAFAGYEYITPAVFELSLKTRYVDDPVSAEMYDIIRESVSYDPGRIFCDSLAGQDSYRKVLATTSGIWTTAASSLAKSLNSKLKQFNKTFVDIKG